MEIFQTNITDVKVVQPIIFEDERGFFLETFEQRRYQKMLGINVDFVQGNHSRSKKGVLRGLHFQKKNPQGKLVRVVRGEVFDVVVDIRKDSPTYGNWISIILSDKNKTQLWIPPGLAHGFVVLSELADFEYKCTNYYDPISEECLLWNDPTININWPILNPILSDKDKLGKTLKEL